MRSKSFFSGTLAALLTLILFSGGVASEKSGYGFNLGEQLPLGQVVNEREMEQGAVVAIWSTSDATSRLVNAWASHRASSEGATFISLCVDASQSDAEFFARLDNVSSNAQVVGGVASEQLSKSTVRRLSQKGLGKIFQTTEGIIQEVEQMDALWTGIQGNV